MTVKKFASKALQLHRSGLMVQLKLEGRAASSDSSWCTTVIDLLDLRSTIKAESAESAHSRIFEDDQVNH